MTVNELMEKLKVIQEKGEGGLPVKVYADLSQMAMGCDQVNIVYVEDSYISDGIYNPDEVDEDTVDSADLIRVVLLEE